MILLDITAKYNPFEAFLNFSLFAVLRSLTMEEIRALIEPLPLQDVTIEPGPAGINWTMKAIKPHFSMYR